MEVALEVNLHRVPWRPEVALGVRLPLPLQLGLHDAGMRERVLASEMSRDQLRLRLSQGARWRWTSLQSEYGPFLRRLCG
jgi:hypothetical protein